MCQFDQHLSHRQYERRAHPSWAPTREPKRELLEVYSNPQTGPLPGPPGSYFSRLSAHNFNQVK